MTFALMIISMLAKVPLSTWRAFGRHSHTWALRGHLGTGWGHIRHLAFEHLGYSGIWALKALVQSSHFIWQTQ